MWISCSSSSYPADGAHTVAFSGLLMWVRFTRLKNWVKRGGGGLFMGNHWEIFYHKQLSGRMVGSDTFAHCFSGYCGGSCWVGANLTATSRFILFFVRVLCVFFFLNKLQKVFNFWGTFPDPLLLRCLSKETCCMVWKPVAVAAPDPDQPLCGRRKVGKDFFICPLAPALAARMKETAAWNAWPSHEAAVPGRTELPATENGLAALRLFCSGFVSALWGSCLLSVFHPPLVSFIRITPQVFAQQIVKEDGIQTTLDTDRHHHLSVFILSNLVQLSGRRPRGRRLQCWGTINYVFFF